MLRVIVLAAAAAIFCAGDRVICVPPAVELTLEARTPAWLPDGALLRYMAPIPAIQTARGEVVPPQPLRRTLRPQLDQAAAGDTLKTRVIARYKMPVIDAPIEIDPRIIVTPDNPDAYPMPVIIPESGVDVASPRGVLAPPEP